MIYRFKREIEESVSIDDSTLRKELGSNYLPLKETIIEDTFGSINNFCRELKVDKSKFRDMSIEDIYNWLKRNDRETFYEFDSNLEEKILILLEEDELEPRISNRKVYIKDE